MPTPLTATPITKAEIQALPDSGFRLKPIAIDTATGTLYLYDSYTATIYTTTGA